MRQSEQGNRSYHAVMCYRRVFRVPETWEGARTLLHSGAVDYEAQVWINGELVAEHTGGRTSFSVDITDYLTDGNQTIIVRASDDPSTMKSRAANKIGRSIPAPSGTRAPRAPGSLL